MPSRLNLVLLALLLALLFGPSLRDVAWAAQPTVAQAEAYYQLPSAPGVFRTVTSGAADSGALETPVDPQPTMGNPNWALSGTFSAHAATATVVVTLYHTTTGGYCGVSFIGTLTGNAALNVDSNRYPAPEVLGGGTRGAKFWDVRVTNVSTGTCQLRGWAYGSEPRVGQ